MKYNVRVVPNSKKSDLICEDNEIKVKTLKPAIAGKANKELIEKLAKYFKVAKGRIKIIKGIKSRNKIVEIEK